MWQLSVINRRLLYLLVILFSLMATDTFALTPDQVYDRVKDSIIIVKAYDERGRLKASGSGVMLPSGKFVTNYHVIKKGAQYSVGQGKNFFPAILEGKDPKKDICILSAKGLNAKPATLGQTANLKVGERVYAIGAPQGLELSLSEGIVSQLRGGPPPLIQTTVAISVGSSGGGLFNAEGELVGITTFSLEDSQNLNFALPVDWISGVAIRKGPESGAIIGNHNLGVPIPSIRPKHDWEKQATAFAKAKDWQGLLAWLRRWTDAEPGNERPWYILANVHDHLGNRRESIEACQKALRLKPDYTDALDGLGYNYLILGYYQDAIKALRLSLQYKPDCARTWLNLAMAYAQSGNRTAALEAFREVRRYDSELSEKSEKEFNLNLKP